MISEYYFMISAYYSWFLHTIYKSNYKDTKHCLKSDRTFFFFLFCWITSYCCLFFCWVTSNFLSLGYIQQVVFSLSLGYTQLLSFFVGLHPTVVLLLLAWSKSNQKIKAQPTGLLRAKATLSPAKLASLKQRRLRTLRLHPPLYARPLRPFLKSSAFSYDCRYCLFFFSFPFSFCIPLFVSLYLPVVSLYLPFYFLVSPFCIPTP